MHRHHEVHSFHVSQILAEPETCATADTTASLLLLEVLRVRDLQNDISLYRPPSCFIVSIQHQSVKYYLADVAKPDKGSYILMESLIHEKNTSRIVNVIMPNEARNVFKLGRGHESDVRRTDISVSRFHASLRCAKEGYFIEDNNSKFGTLALVQNVELSPIVIRAVQVGRTAVSLSVKLVELEPYPVYVTHIEMWPRRCWR